LQSIAGTALAMRADVRYCKFERAARGAAHVAPHDMSGVVR
jgi:hypothetical protein